MIASFQRGCVGVMTSSVKSARQGRGLLIAQVAPHTQAD
ncbi:Uncharacterised protein [Vibrio cholerae]|nr:Uncharacterised protein [Vibrio cholerae]